MIFYIIYLSSAKGLYSDGDLSDILIKSRVNNKQKDITGILLYHEGNILQILEGNKETVLNLFYKIQEDERHQNVIKMIAGTCDERNFPDWSMGFKAVTDAQWKDYEGYLRLDPAGIIPQLKEGNVKIDTMIESFMTVNIRQ